MKLTQTGNKRQPRAIYSINANEYNTLNQLIIDIQNPSFNLGSNIQNVAVKACRSPYYTQNPLVYGSQTCFNETNINDENKDMFDDANLPKVHYSVTI
jgi:hypothetical protein